MRSVSLAHAYIPEHKHEAYRATASVDCPKHFTESPEMRKRAMKECIALWGLCKELGTYAGLPDHIKYTPAGASASTSLFIIPEYLHNFTHFRKNYETVARKLQNPLDKSAASRYNTKAVCNSGRNMGV